MGPWKGWSGKGNEIKGLGPNRKQSEVRCVHSWAWHPCPPVWLKGLEGRREATCSAAIHFHSGGHSGHSSLVFLSAESFFISDLTNKKRNLWSISYSANKYAEMSLVLAEKSHAHMHPLTVPNTLLFYIDSQGFIDVFLIPNFPLGVPVSHFSKCSCLQC